MAAITFIHSATAQSADNLVARVVMSTGEVSAFEAGVRPRPLTRSSGINLGETISTGADGVVQLRFREDALISLGCNSVIQLIEDDSLTPRRIVIELIAGRVRAITGQNESEKFLLRVGSAVLDPTATENDLRVTRINPDAIHFSILHGSGDVRAEEGSLSLGVNADFDFALLETGSPPRGVREMVQSDCQ